MNNPNNNFGNRTSDILACIAVTQAAAPPRAPNLAIF